MNRPASTEPLFTVIIPAKNRARFLRHTLRTCTMQEYERLEVIVSDDGSTDDTRELVEEAAHRDPRIRYVSTPLPGMRENFEYALRQAKPGFVLALGGDDGLMPHGISGMSEIVRETGLELLAWPTPVYSYPGVRGPASQLMVPKRRKSRVVSSAEFLRRQATQLHYLSDTESPMFYVKGAASTVLIDRVRGRSVDGRFYRCPTPDGYSGIVLAGEVSEYAFSGKPLSIHGLSPASQGLAYVSNDDKAKTTSSAFIRDASTVPMHAALASQPYSPLVTLMTADYLLTARDLPGWPGRVPEIDYRHVLLKSLEELGHGLFGGDRVGRELAILDRIAAHHGLAEFFRQRVKRARRHRSREPFCGTGLNRSAIFLDGASYGIGDLVDAAYVAHAVASALPDLLPRAIARTLYRSLRYRLASMGRAERFPSPAEWNS